MMNMYTPIERVHAAYNLVRNGHVSRDYLKRVHDVYLRASVTEVLSIADIVLLETIETEAHEHDLGRTAKRGSQAVH